MTTNAQNRPRGTYHAKGAEVGFSLLEVLIALAILGIAVAFIVSFFPTSLENTQLAAQRAVVSELAESSLNRYRSSSAEHLWETIARLQDIYPMYLASGTGETQGLYESYYSLFTPLRGAEDTFLQRVTFTVSMPDGRNESFVTYIAEQ